MKKVIILIFVFIVFLIILITSLGKRLSETTYYEKEYVKRREIIEQLFLPGNIYPHRETEVKSSMSGILNEYYVSLGDIVAKGDSIASIDMSPSSIETVNYKLAYQKAEILYKNSLSIYLREKRLYEQGAISKAEYDHCKFDKDIKLAEYQNAKLQYQLISGDSLLSEQNIILSPSDGVVLDLPLNPGSSVIERNNYNVGTTLAYLGDMSSYIFRGEINELEIPRLSIGDSIEVRIEPYEDYVYYAIIEKIYPKPIIKQGIVKYVFEAIFQHFNSLNIFPGMSGYSKITINERKNVLSVSEKSIYFRNDSTFVYKLSKNKKVEQYIETGVKDGVYIEIISGLKEGDVVIVE